MLTVTPRGRVTRVFLLKPDYSGSVSRVDASEGSDVFLFALFVMVLLVLCWYLFFSLCVYLYFLFSVSFYVLFVF